MPDLFMVRLKLDSRRVMRELAHHQLPSRQDTAYLVHSTLAGLFGEGTLQPFRVLEDPQRWLTVLAYSARGDAELHRHAQEFADPSRYEACDWQAFAVKPLPEAFEAGRRLGFEVRVCPVVRLNEETEIDHGGKRLSFAKKSEVDAWLHRRTLAHEPDVKISREECYGAWLQARLGAAAQVRAVRLEGFHRVRLVRRTHEEKRQARAFERPDALLRGELVVGDPQAFHTLLATGVGRHRSYGFGMLLLRPPENRC